MKVYISHIAACGVGQDTIIYIICTLLCLTHRQAVNAVLADENRTKIEGQACTLVHILVAGFGVLVDRL